MRTIGSRIAGSVPFLAVALVMAVGSPNASRAAETVDKAKLEEIKKKRKEIAGRKRRILYDNDGNEPVYYCKDATAKSLLEKRTCAVIGSQVDTIIYCTWSSGFSYFTHDTKIGKLFTCTVKDFKNNKTAEFIKQGTDPLRIMVDYCREKKVEIFWSMRMNDTHDAWGGWYSPYMFPPLKKEHPEWLVGSKDSKPVNGAWTAVDYGVKEIRDLAYRFFEEVCENYDVDGVVMDFFRHPLYFKRHAHGKACGREEWDKMTDLIRRIREMADRVGARRGRPILIAARTPDSAAYSKAMGLDVETWMKDGLIDFWVVSGYFRLCPWEKSAKLGHKYGVKVFPSLSETRIRDSVAKKPRASLPCYRARAMNAHDAGMDGIYMFNFFNPHSPLWRQVGTPETMTGLDKVYTTGARGVGVINRWHRGGHKQFLERAPLSPESPRKLEPGKAVTVDLRIGEDLSKTTKQIKPAKLTLQLRFKDLAAIEEIAVKLNGKSLSGRAKSKAGIDYALEPTMTKRGTNKIEVTLAPGSKSKAVLTDLMLWVKHAKAKS